MNCILIILGFAFLFYSAITGEFLHDIETQINTFGNVPWQHNPITANFSEKYNLHQHKTNIKREGKLAMIEPEDIKTLLGHFVQKLRMFVSAEGLEVDQFEIQVGYLRNEFIWILDLAEDLLPQNKQLVVLVEFSSYALQSMIKSSEFLKNIELNSDRCFMCLCIVHFSVKMLVSKSFISTNNIEDYSINLAIHLKYLKFWNEAFEYLVHSPKSLRIMFEEQLTCADYLLYAMTYCDPKETTFSKKCLNI